MKEDDKKLIWKLLDGEGTPAEREHAQQRRSEDADFNLEFGMRAHLHESLQKTEAEQPSMRFVLNVMDKLPQLYRRTVKPLIRPIWVKGFLYAVLALLIGSFGIGMYYVTITDEISPEAAPGAETVSNFFNALPTQTWLMLGMIGFSYLFFVWLDKALRKRFQNKQQTQNEVR